MNTLVRNPTSPSQHCSVVGSARHCRIFIRR
ncbi:unnamed protein product [Penicillium camemberti]|uniref:Str. FM013 n=1 Tax=Penicillium camemberti (strain FM 013) TaxID=1429867 RepID=A0A0G4PPV3_PENC3|nr:unnamed protein product [Penicillium camemberti]